MWNKLIEMGTRMTRIRQMFTDFSSLNKKIRKYQQNPRHPRSQYNKSNNPFEKLPKIKNEHQIDT